MIFQTSMIMFHVNLQGCKIKDDPILSDIKTRRYSKAMQGQKKYEMILLLEEILQQLCNGELICSYLHDF